MLTAALPPEVQPTTVWPAWPLERVRDELEIQAGETLVDLGCGRGEIGLWLAVAAGARLIGVDPSPVGLELARERASQTEVDATFMEGVLQQTGLDDGVADAVVITDVMHFVEDDRPAAFAEIRRILRPGRRVVVVGPERSDSTAAFSEAGFDIEVRAETPDWRQTVADYASVLMREAKELEAELGDMATELIARVQTAARTASWHGLTVARRAIG
jgi:ubiquinone/menaquinone biosynthesis C-methylase UbiE